MGSQRRCFQIKQNNAIREKIMLNRHDRNKHDHWVSKNSHTGRIKIRKTRPMGILVRASFIRKLSVKKIKTLPFDEGKRFHFQHSRI